MENLDEKAALLNERAVQAARLAVLRVARVRARSDVERDLIEFQIRSLDQSILDYDSVIEARRKAGK